jgi:hypothetical protein
MSFLDKIKSIFSPGSSATFTGSGRMCVVDAAGLARGDGKVERLSPGVQIKVLQRLSRFAEKESVPICAVFEGKELRAVEHGGDFQGIKVFFASKPGSREEMLLGFLKGRGSDVTIVAGTPKLEAMVLERGGQFMRLGTFRKGLEGPGEGSNGGRSQGRKKGPRRRGGPQKDRNDRSDRGQDRRKRGGDDRPPQDVDPVHQLIDVVE